MRVVVTGGRGLIGRWSVDELARAGHEVVCIVRDDATRADDRLRQPGRVVHGDVADPLVVAEACDGADALVHLAAIPEPVGHTARELIEANVLTTVNVLEVAAEAGLKGAVIASSISVLGMAWSPEPMSPVYVPVDEAHPLRPAEAYALSKECDEASARMTARRWGMPVYALRFPFTQTMEEILARSLRAEERVSMAKELWAYLDVLDAARSVRIAMEAAVAGPRHEFRVLNIVADDVCIDEPLDALMRTWHPDTRDIRPGSRGAYDVSAAEEIGFRATRLVHAAD